MTNLKDSTVAVIITVIVAIVTIIAVKVSKELSEPSAPSYKASHLTCIDKVVYIEWTRKITAYINAETLTFQRCHYDTNGTLVFDK
jgi:predicted lipoprotein